MKKPIKATIGKRRIITYEKQNTNGEVCITTTNKPTNKTHQKIVLETRQS